MHQRHHRQPTSRPQDSRAPTARAVISDDGVVIRRARFDPHPTTEAGYRLSRRWLRAAFARWSDQTASEYGPDCFEELIHYKWGYLDGHLTRWQRDDLEAILLKLFPAKVIVEDGDLDDVIPQAETFIAFLADTALLDPASDDPDQLCAHLHQIKRRFQRRMADRTRYSPGKRFWLAAAQAGVPLDDHKAVAAFVKQFNSQPDTERAAVLGQHSTLTPSPSQRGRVTPPGARPRSTPTRRRRARR